MTLPIDINTIITLHHDSIISWKTKGVYFAEQGFFQLVEENHAFNFLLWHTEDKARRDDLGFEFVYRAKREIDHYNQKRNNGMEKMDSWLFDYLKPSQQQDCMIHSETPGMMIDRLSILALKSYHMHLQTQRQDVEDAHRQHCLQKWQVICQQQQQLQQCLQAFIIDVQAQKRTFRIYHQFKMYNDPTLNPELSAVSK
jgi:hypothetical protein